MQTSTSLMIFWKLRLDSIGSCQKKMQNAQKNRLFIGAIGLGTVTSGPKKDSVERTEKTKPFDLTEQ
jgi:hypothetical protein